MSLLLKKVTTLIVQARLSVSLVNSAYVLVFRELDKLADIPSIVRTAFKMHKS
jgi:hypothetical protein